MAIIFETDDLNIDQIRASINQKSTICKTLQEVQQLLEADGEFLMVVGPSIPMRQVATLSKTFRINRPTLGCVVVRDFISEKEMGIALESGVRSVVKSGDANAIQEAVTNSVILSEEIAISLGTSGVRHLSRVVSVFSPKGGAGKTTFAVNLASALSKQADIRVCLLDLDLNFGDVGIFLGKKSEVNLGLLVGSQGILNQTAIEGLTLNAAKNLDLILSPSTPKVAEKLDHARVLELIRVLRLRYDYVVLDTDGSFSNLNLDVFDLSDEIFIITTPDLPSIKDTLTGLELMESLGVARGKRELVLNRINSRFGISRKEAEDLLGTQVNVALPDTHDVSRAINRSRSVIDYRPSSAISKTFLTLAKRIHNAMDELPKLSLATSLANPASPTPEAQLP